MNLNDIGIHFKKKTNYYNNKKNKVVINQV